MTTHPTNAAADPSADFPTAVVRPARAATARGGWWIWLLPSAALVVVVVLFLQALAQRGPAITIGFLNGQGLKVGDPMVYRGVRVGEITAIRISTGLDGLEVDARLTRDAAKLAREGSRFWIVRPEVSLSRVSGLETLLGPRYIEVLPPPGSSGSATVGIVTSFRGLEDPPTAVLGGGGTAPASNASEGTPGSGASSSADPERGPLTLILEAARLGSTQPGSPVLYRGFKVGQVLQTSLAPTGQRVEVRVEIFPEHAHLVRKTTRWCISSGIGIDFGLVGGLSVRTGSLESVISGGVSFATPDRPGPRAVNGDRFELEPEPGKDWADWSPNLREHKGGGSIDRTPTQRP